MRAPAASTLLPMLLYTALAARLVATAVATAQETAADRATRRAQALQRHSWDDNARQTLQVYRRVVVARPTRRH